MCEKLLDDILPVWGICTYESGCYIAAAFPYRLPEEFYAARNVSRYAVVRDYHAVCGARLERACGRLRASFPGKAFEWRCDNSSLPEVALAEGAGLGHRGRHNLLITPAYGSWVFLGVIAVEDQLELLGSTRRADGAPYRACCAGTARGREMYHSGSGENSTAPGRIREAEPVGRGLAPPCTTCPGYCVAACPTGALGPSGFDKTRCVSYISQRRGDLSPEEARLLRQTGTAWGCDICQEACPQNQSGKIDPLPEFLTDPVAHVTGETPLEGRAFAWRGRGVIRRNIAVLEGASHG